MNQIKPNIYHILFDGFHSLNFLRALKQLNITEGFNGFTFFAKNRANYDDTFASFPSLLSGNFYEKGSFKQWIDIQNNPGFLSNLNEAGYRLNQYTDNKNFLFGNTSQKRLYIDLLNHYKKPESNTSKLIKQYDYIVKYQLTERIGKGVRLFLSKFIKLFNIWLTNNSGYPSFSLDRFILSDYLLSLPLMLNFIDDEKERSSAGQYNFTHIMLPHSPYNWTRNFNASESSYEEQVYCAVNLMILLINELKRLHRFNNSLIIFHADHGWSEVDFQYPDLSDIPENVTHKIQQSINCTPTRFLHRSHALLLIKPPGTDGQQPLEISDRLTQLSDIPATICHLLNLNFSSHHGLPLFSEKRNGKREIHLFAGLHKYNKLGLKCDFGKHFFKGLLAHFSIKQDNYWKIHPDLPISWH